LVQQVSMQSLQVRDDRAQQQALLAYPEALDLGMQAIYDPLAGVGPRMMRTDLFDQLADRSGQDGHRVWCFLTCRVGLDSILLSTTDPRLSRTLAVRLRCGSHTTAAGSLWDRINAVRRLTHHQPLILSASYAKYRR